MIDIVDAMISRGATRVTVTIGDMSCSVEGLRKPDADPPRVAAVRDATEEARRRADVDRVLFPPEPEDR